MRDKGDGMGATVGYIPTMLGDAVKLAAHGNVFRVDAQSLVSWRQWWRYVHLDACGARMASTRWVAARDRPILGSDG